MLKQLVRSATFVCALLITGVPTAALAQTERGLTEQQVVQAFLQQHRVDQWLAEQRQAIQAQRDGAALLANPELELSYEPMSYADGSEENELALWLTQSFEAWGARGYRQQAADLQAQVATTQLHITLRDQLAEVRTKFYHLVMLTQQYQQQQRFTQQLTELVAQSQQQLELEEQSRLDHFRLQQTLSSAQLKTAELAREAVALSHELEALTGLNIEQQLAAPLLPQELSPETLNQLRAPTHNLELAMLQQLRERLAAEQQAAEARVFPEVTVGLGMRRIEDAQGQHSEAAASLGVELPLFQRGQYEAARLVPLQTALSIEFERLQCAQQQQFASLKKRLRATLQSLQQSQLHNTEQMLATARQAYWLGEISVTELIDIQRTQQTLSADLLNHQFNARVDWIHLQQLSYQPEELKR
ncbi:TolC family protein [Pseudidiomarina sp. CB1]|uniref:TolC family protein n=1 Tax=Pseudidiomarina sp. CB1 TaxID=2972484 RepID=UPI0021636561|nr:TolC family protein [Pseudidiomarina sp. CB1]